WVAVPSTRIPTPTLRPRPWRESTWRRRPWSSPPTTRTTGDGMAAAGGPRRRALAEARRAPRASGLLNQPAQSPTSRLRPAMLFAVPFSSTQRIAPPRPLPGEYPVRRWTRRRDLLLDPGRGRHRRAPRRLREAAGLHRRLRLVRHEVFVGRGGWARRRPRRARAGSLGLSLPAGLCHRGATPPGAR